MRIAVATLADAANVREGMLNVLSAGINLITREEYPAPLYVTLVLLLEILPEDGLEEIEVDISLENLTDGSSECAKIAEIVGKFGGDTPIIPSATLPFIMPDTSNLIIPTAGTYRLIVEVSGLDPVYIPFDAALATP